MIARELNINDIQFIPIRKKRLFISEMRPLLKKYLIVDEIYDTVNTFSKVFHSFRGFDCDLPFLMIRYRNRNAKVVAKILNHDKYIVFPWERKSY